MAGVYLSYPFCAQKCTYCNFASGVFGHELEARYGPVLLEEIRSQHWSWRPETVYIGGGTPSTMPLPLLRDLLAAIPGRPWREATIEAAPGTLTPERVHAWHDAGLNRVSLGVQSFVSRELSQTGRKHTASTVFAEVETVRAAGIDNINIDLIAGLPWQTRESWAESLDCLERIGAPHVSVYMFEIDTDSRLGLEVLQDGRRYGAGAIPDDALTAELYQTAVERLARSSVERYEISNFARPGFESIHNLKYWQLEPYIGFGSDAHSFDAGERWANPETPTDYTAKRMSPERTPAHPGEERFFVGLRLMRGVTLDRDEWAKFDRPIERLIAAGLLARDGDVIRLTSHGVLLSNEVFQEFIAA
jgi:oxygen-independent coproporphyrinogen III oxidase